MARHYGKTTQYGSYNYQHHYHGDKTNQTDNLPNNEHDDYIGYWHEHMKLQA